MIFAFVLFGTGIVVQVGGQDFNRMIYIRLKINYMWRSVSRPLWTWMTKNPDMMLYTCREIDAPVAVGNDSYQNPEVGQLRSYRLLFCEWPGCGVLFARKV